MEGQRVSSTAARLRRGSFGAAEGGAIESRLSTSSGRWFFSHAVRYRGGTANIDSAVHCQQCSQSPNAVGEGMLYG